MGGCKTWCSANRRRGGALATLCRKNFELVKWGKCEATKKVSGEGRERMQARNKFDGENSVERKMMGGCLLSGKMLQAKTKSWGKSNCMAVEQSSKVQRSKVPR